MTNNIHSFKLIEYIDAIQIRQKQMDEYVNKLTTSMLIAQNSKVHKPTNINLRNSHASGSATLMTRKSLVGSTLIWQSEPNKHLNKREKKNNATQRRQTKQRRTKTTESRKKNLIRYENHLFKWLRYSVGTSCLLYIVLSYLLILKISA